MMKKLLIIGLVISMFLLVGCHNQEYGKITVEKGITKINESGAFYENGTMAEHDYFDNLSDYLVVNQSTRKDITSMLTIDCSLLEVYENITIEVIFNESEEEMFFIEMCNRLKNQGVE
jgi:major membrane immunogen (membrane-anchored lipoprotein)